MFRQAVKHHLLFLGVGAAVMFTQLGDARLWDRHEPRNACCTSEMLKRGDWVTPYFNGELRTDKPVLVYWLMMTSYQIFGASEFAARFWSAALALGTVTFTYHLGRRLFHPQAGLWAALVLATAFMFDVAGRSVNCDSALIFFSTAALLVYVMGVFRPRSSDDAASPPELRLAGQWFPSWPWAAGMYALLGVAVLAKGPVGLILPAAVVGMFLLIVRLQPRPEGSPGWKRRFSGLFRPFAPLHFVRTCWLMRPFTAVAVAGAVALPWYVWVGVRTDGDWLRGFLLSHNLERATSAYRGHGGPIVYYPLAVLFGFLPWSIFAAPLLIDLKARLQGKEAWKRGYLLACCWAGVWVGAFSLVQTKAPTYVTPMYPALALLGGAMIFRWTRGELLASAFWLKASMAVAASVTVASLLAIPIVCHYVLPGEEVLGLIGLVMLGALFMCGALTKKDRKFAAAGVFAAAAACTAILVLGVGAARVDRHRQMHVMLADIAACSEHPRLMCVETLQPSWVYYSGQFITSAPSDEAALEFLAEDANHFLIVRPNEHERIASRLPRDVDVISRTSYFPKRGEILVLGRPDSPVARNPRDGAVR